VKKLSVRRPLTTVARRGSPQPIEFDFLFAKLQVVDGYLGSYATLGLVLAAGVLVFVGAFGANRLLRPSQPAEPPGKRIAYESGIDPVGGDWAQAQIR